MENQNKETKGQTYVAAWERERGSQLTGRQKEVIYRSFALGLTERDIDGLLFLESLPEQEYAIGCFLNGLSKEVIQEEILAAKDWNEMKEIKINFFVKERRPKQQAALLASQLSQVQLEKEQLERELWQLRVSWEEQKRNLADQQAEIQRREREIRELNENFTRERLKKPERLIKEIRTFQKPETFRERLRYLLGKADLKELTWSETSEDQSLTGKVCDILCDPKFTIGQLLELQQGILDGLSAADIGCLANPDLSREKMKATRRFLSQLAGRAFTETRETEIQMKTEEQDEWC
ncbi:MAG: hypothetical protein HFE75_13445 [Firmicutes bacterium]|nr:hypothetical protein [Bacillota bacterium]